MRMMLSSSFALLVCVCSVIDTRAIEEGESNYVADNFIDAVTQKAGQNDGKLFLNPTRTGGGSK